MAAETSTNQMPTLDTVVTPCLLVDMDVVRRNCTTMRERCEKLGVRLRPMMKTHKTAEIGALMTGPSKTCLSVSTLKEAEFYADHGFDDILLAFMVTHDKIPRILTVARQVSLLHVMVDHTDHVTLLEKHPLPGDAPWSVLLKVNCGDNRAGALWDGGEVVSLGRRIHDSPSLVFEGLYVHDGRSYQCRGARQLEEYGAGVVDRVVAAADRLRAERLVFRTVGVGSTPTSSVPPPNASKLTELHPGNYVFNDVQQTILGSCKREDIAVKVATRVKGHFPERNEMLVDAGFLAMSKDGHAAYDTELDGSFCWVEGEPNLRLVSMCQEVGVIGAREDGIDFDKHPIGSLLFLLPYHSCATACQFTEYYACEGGHITDVFTPCKGW